MPRAPKSFRAWSTAALKGCRAQRDISFGLVGRCGLAVGGGSLLSGLRYFGLGRVPITLGARRGKMSQHAAQQGAAPDRLQLRSFLTSLPAAGELGRCVAAPAAMREAGSTLAAGRWLHGAIFAGAGVSAGAACSLWRGVWVSDGETNQQQHNQALHPTARSVVVFPALSLGW